MPYFSEPVAPYRRHLADRRQANLRSLVYALFLQRRRSRRRMVESGTGYFDRYNTVTFLIALSLMLLCTFDSYFTLLLINRGSVELNPLWAWALERHVLLFFVGKYLLTGMAVIMSVLHGEFRLFGVRGVHLLSAGVVAYAVLVEYQLSMLLPFWLN